jgi:D-glycero-D-manno-heptose 1,7-bisphosphate phosphatase
MLPMPVQAVFLDKDGTLIENVPYNVDPQKIKFMDDVIPGVKKLSLAGFRLIIVTNQSGVARGFFHEDDVKQVGRHIEKVFKQNGVPLLDFYYCPHHPDGNVPAYKEICACRKPAEGLLLKAKLEHDVDLPRSWFIGDILDDVESGRRAGCRTILINNGHETEWQVTTPLRKPHAMVSNFKEAVDVILQSE